jgi:hypothetical protein
MRKIRLTQIKFKIFSGSIEKKDGRKNDKKKNIKNVIEKTKKT